MGIMRLGTGHVPNGCIWRASYTVLHASRETAKALSARPETCGTTSVSLLTGQLSIPPLAGVGTGVDLAILLAGLAAAILMAKKEEPAKAEEMGLHEGQ
jgi:uncharacterized NAD-dependent epimerase/dehydratase family protein